MTFAWLRAVALTFPDRVYRTQETFSRYNRHDKLTWRSLISTRTLESFNGDDTIYLLVQAVTFIASLLALWIRVGI
jgi:hypothetical protein